MIIDIETEWKPVKRYEGLYEINENGVVRSLHKNNFGYIMEQRIDRGGYNTVRLASPSIKSSTNYVHRLLGYAFIPNPQEKPLINHIDGDKLNNSVSNLEWVTHSENMQHAYKLGLCKVPSLNKRKVIDTCSQKIFESVSDAAKYFSIKYATCKNYLNGNRSNPTCLRYLNNAQAA